ncbi:hypothetical protein E2C01_077536 [Portunus trituberculatus]|uniref:Uncharacterized protein n=1 Tax=Portunus trituberculatus TaxID=210409 RepID=A0A5B7IEQ1_PORTR|nr:hypothetical protein [Portunus trituberculatus]
MYGSQRFSVWWACGRCEPQWRGFRQHELRVTVLINIHGSFLPVQVTRRGAPPPRPPRHLTPSLTKVIHTHHKPPPSSKTTFQNKPASLNTPVSEMHRSQPDVSGGGGGGGSVVRRGIR